MRSECQYLPQEALLTCRHVPLLVVRTDGPEFRSVNALLLNTLPDPNRLDDWPMLGLYLLKLSFPTAPHTPPAPSCAWAIRFCAKRTPSCRVSEPATETCVDNESLSQRLTGHPGHLTVNFGYITRGGTYSARSSLFGLRPTVASFSSACRATPLSSSPSLL